MAFEKFLNDKRICLLVLIGIPLIASTNIDCGGKSFHCLNTTHFMICVDLGGGVSTTVDDYVIPCPPPTVCLGTNHFECEFPVSSTQAPTVQDIVTTNEIEATTLDWEAVGNITTSSSNAIEQHLELTTQGAVENVADTTITLLEVPVENKTDVIANQTENIENQSMNGITEVKSPNTTETVTIINKTENNIIEKETAAITTEIPHTNELVTTKELNQNVENQSEIAIVTTDSPNITESITILNATEILNTSEQPATTNELNQTVENQSEIAIIMTDSPNITESVTIINATEISNTSEQPATTNELNQNVENQSEIAIVTTDSPDITESVTLLNATEISNTSEQPATTNELNQNVENQSEIAIITTGSPNITESVTILNATEILNTSEQPATTNELNQNVENQSEIAIITTDSPNITESITILNATEILNTSEQPATTNELNQNVENQSEIAIVTTDSPDITESVTLLNATEISNTSEQSATTNELNQNVENQSEIAIITTDSPNITESITILNAPEISNTSEQPATTNELNQNVENQSEIAIVTTDSPGITETINLLNATEISNTSEQPATTNELNQEVENQSEIALITTDSPNITESVTILNETEISNTSEQPATTNELNQNVVNQSTNGDTIINLPSNTETVTIINTTEQDITIDNATVVTTNEISYNSKQPAITNSPSMTDTVTIINTTEQEIIIENAAVVNTNGVSYTTEQPAITNELNQYVENQYVNGVTITNSPSITETVPIINITEQDNMTENAIEVNTNQISYTSEQPAITNELNQYIENQSVNGVTITNPPSITETVPIINIIEQDNMTENAIEVNTNQISYTSEQQAITNELNQYVENQSVNGVTLTNSPSIIESVTMKNITEQDNITENATEVNTNEISYTSEQSAATNGLNVENQFVNAVTITNSPSITETGTSTNTNEQDINIKNATEISYTSEQSAIANEQNVENQSVNGDTITNSSGVTETITITNTTEQDIIIDNATEVNTNEISYTSQQPATTTKLNFENQSVNGVTITNSSVTEIFNITNTTELDIIIDNVTEVDTNEIMYTSEQPTITEDFNQNIENQSVITDLTYSTESVTTLNVIEPPIVAVSEVNIDGYTTVIPNTSEQPAIRNEWNQNVENHSVIVIVETDLPNVTETAILTTNESVNFIQTVTDGGITEIPIMVEAEDRQNLTPNDTTAKPENKTELVIEAGVTETFITSDLESNETILVDDKILLNKSAESVSTAKFEPNVKSTEEIVVYTEGPIVSKTRFNDVNVPITIESITVKSERPSIKEIIDGRTTESGNAVLPNVLTDHITIDSHYTTTEIFLVNFGMETSKAVIDPMRSTDSVDTIDVSSNNDFTSGTTSNRVETNSVTNAGIENVNPTTLASIMNTSAKSVEGQKITNILEGAAKEEISASPIDTTVASDQLFYTETSIAQNENVFDTITTSTSSAIDDWLIATSLKNKNDTVVNNQTSEKLDEYTQNSTIVIHLNNGLSNESLASATSAAITHVSNAMNVNKNMSSNVESYNTHLNIDSSTGRTDVNSVPSDIQAIDLTKNPLLNLPLLNTENQANAESTASEFHPDETLSGSIVEPETVSTPLIKNVPSGAAIESPSNLGENPLENVLLNTTDITQNVAVDEHSKTAADDLNAITESSNSESNVIMILENSTHTKIGNDFISAPTEFLDASTQATLNIAESQMTTVQSKVNSTLELSTKSQQSTYYNGIDQTNMKEKPNQTNLPDNQVLTIPTAIIAGESPVNIIKQTSSTGTDISTASKTIVEQTGSRFSTFTVEPITSSTSLLNLNTNNNMHQTTSNAGIKIDKNKVSWNDSEARAVPKTTLDHAQASTNGEIINSENLPTTKPSTLTDSIIADFNTTTTMLLETSAALDNINKQDYPYQHVTSSSSVSETTEFVNPVQSSTLEMAVSQNEGLKSSVDPLLTGNKVNKDTTIPSTVVTELSTHQESTSEANEYSTTHSGLTEISSLSYPELRKATTIAILPLSETKTTERNVAIESLSTTEKNTMISKNNTGGTLRQTIAPASDSSTEKIANSSVFDCRVHVRGRYADSHDCRKFYICNGTPQPIVGLCPSNTVFSNIIKLCTKNLSHCIRENQFQCVSNGRFADFSKQNVYYVCVRKGTSFLRYKLQCQNGYYLNRATVRCYKGQESSSISISTDNSQSTSVKKEEKTQRHQHGKRDKKKHKSKEVVFECEKEGKFSYPDDCRKYYVCSKSNRSEQFKLKVKKCDSDESFHRKKKKCVDSSSYECS